MTIARWLYPVYMARLIALDMPGCHQFVETVLRIWDNGDAVLPIDQRLPDAAKKSLITSMAPAGIIDSHGAATAFAESRAMEDGDALVIATSGSTGVPKGVVHTHSSLSAASQASTNRLNLSSSNTWLVCIPVSHIGGFSVITRALHSQASLILQPAFDVDAVTQAVRDGATHTSLVSTALSRIDAAAFQTILLGGSSAPSNLPNNVVTTYGMTESGGGVVYNGFPLDGVELKIVEDEIYIRCAMLFRNYRHETSASTHDGWYSTGDLGSIDQTGRLQVFGRRTDMIISGGENIWPATVEKSLLTHPLVEQVVVRGTPDAQWGQQVVAYVVLDSAVSQTAPEALRAQLRDHVKQSLPAFCAPQKFVVVNDIPRTSLGKVDVPSLPSP